MWSQHNDFVIDGQYSRPILYFVSGWESVHICIFFLFMFHDKKNHSFHYYYTVKRFNPEVMARLSALKVVIKYSIKPVCHITLQQYAE